MACHNTAEEKGTIFHFIIFLVQILDRIFDACGKYASLYCALHTPNPPASTQTPDRQ